MIFQILIVNTIHMVHLVDIKFGKLVFDVNWWVFSLVTRAIQITRKSWIRMSIDSA